MLDDKNKQAIKQVGKAVGVSTGIGAGIGAAGALINKKIKKKKENLEMNKEAFDLVNDTFEKVAGIKEVLNGKNIKRAVNDVKGGSAVIHNFQKNLKFTEPSARQASREAIGVMNKDLTRMKGRVFKEGAKTVGAYAGAGATAVTGTKALINKKEEKTASYIVNEVFEKVALEQDKKDAITVGLGGTAALTAMPLVFNSINGAKEVARRHPDAINTFKGYMKGTGKDTLKIIPGAALGSGAGALAGYGLGKAVKNHKKKKEEKTASDIVNEVFEKVAFVGVGKTIKSSKNGRFGVSVGIPYGVSGDMTLGNGSTRPKIGVGLTGPHVGVSFNNPDTRKKKVDKKADKKKEEKTASDIVREVFEKIGK